jgi:2-polyprenyl-3-methyl-5-hydroxy-6-metoxy-1,4-benzoquinol methylase
MKNKTIVAQFSALRQVSGGFRASRVILTANNLGIFEHLSSPKTASALAKKIITDTRATEILLDAVTSLGLLKKTGASFRNTQLASTFLIKSSPWYQGDMLRHTDHLWKNWSGLDAVVKSGKPNRIAGRDYEVFIRAMHNNAVLRAPSVVDAIGLKGVKTALDLGGGPGTYSAEFAKRGINATLFDMPEALKVARTLVKQKNVRFLGGNFHADDFGGAYDLVLVSQVLHSLSIDESIELLKKIHTALNPNGKLVIHEFLLAEDRAHPVPAALFSINMLVNTEAGRSYTPKEMSAWLRKAGFKKTSVKPLTETVLVTGTK